MVNVTEGFQFLFKTLTYVHDILQTLRGMEVLMEKLANVSFCASVVIICVMNDAVSSGGFGR